MDIISKKAYKLINRELMVFDSKWEHTVKVHLTHSYIFVDNSFYS